MNNTQSANHNASSNGAEAFSNASDFQNVPQYGQYTPQADPFLHQPEMLDSRARHSPMANSLSPSTINDRFSPETFMSDGSMNGPSTYTTPGFDEQLFEGHFGQVLNIQDGTPVAATHFGSFQSQRQQLNDYENHLPTSSPYASNTIPTAPILPSPQSTHRSSPVVPQNFGRQRPGIATNQEALFSAPGMQHIAGVPHRQQPSPALTSSSVAVSSSDVSSQLHLVVTIDDYADEDQGGLNLTRTMSRRSHGSRRANTHLSPYPDEESEDEVEPEQTGDAAKDHIAFQQSAASLQQVDGPWIADEQAPSRIGVEPELRKGINTEDILSIEELEERRILSDRNKGVADWLTRSNVGSDAEDVEISPRRSRKKSSKGRPRAKSTNDAAFGNNNTGLGVSNPVFDDSLIPGPGIYLKEPSDFGEDDDSGTDEELESPAAELTSFREEKSYFPSFDSAEPSAGGKSMQDIEPSPAPAEGQSDTQGITANLAIMRFCQRAKETDNASLTATVGSRRRSESDIASVVNSTGISKLLLSPQPAERKSVRRRGSFLESILPNRTTSNKMKRKNSQQQDAADSAPSPKEGAGAIATPKRIGSFGKPKSPRVDTSFSSAGADARSPSAVAAAASGAFAHARQIFRSRSRSDLGKPLKGPGLADLWTQSGGPPMPALASPLNPRPVHNLGARDGDDDSGDDDAVELDGVAMDLSVRTDMHVIPTYDGFKYQARQLNPRLTEFLLERVTQEQMKRYKRLVDLKLKHSQSAPNRTCMSKAFCFASGGDWKPLPPRAGNRDPDATLVGFQILSAGMTEDDIGMTNEGQMVAAQFPSGVPIPPVTRLPAEFECPLCFKVKKFYKPSDWTKHVHEDIQPFTCTFQGCNEPKSFKRKADWVRHENERHRQLEAWTCDIGECTHTCYRKDNFVQHLVREHKVPEPKVRNGRNGGSRSPATPLEPLQVWTSLGFSEEGIDDVWALVDRCHKDATKQPKDEPCKFCGNICSSWKKLTVHLAKHMEQISMPVLALVDQKRVTASLGLLAGQYSAPPLSIPLTKPLGDLPTFMCDEPMEMEIDARELAVNGVASSVMQSYPSSTSAFQAQVTSQASIYGSPSESYAGSSYPPPSVSSRSRAASFNGQGTTYPPAAFTGRSMQSASPTPVYDNQQIFFQPGAPFLAADGMSNAYLTPTSATPANTGYSPTGSVQDFQRTYGYQAR